jgi:phosphoenolpyruvate synthase/pyruvate phosphate dikinase
MKFTKGLEELTKKDSPLAGGKGASLGEMIQAGIPVPSGFVILSRAFDQFLEEAGLNIEIDSILHTVNHQEIHTVENASKKIRALILKTKISKDIAQEIINSFNSLGAKYVAVRSSATVEDTLSAAWAGQLESYLNTTKKDLLKNIQLCWASLFTPRAIFYRFEKGLYTNPISVAIVIQKMIQSEISGIAFSVHPVTQDRNQLIIEAVRGLGEAIVSGKITPNSYVIQKEPLNILDKKVSAQKKALFRAQSGGNKWLNIERKKIEKQILKDAEILDLSELILKIEAHYKFPCDIEFAYKKGAFHIVQSRPITTLTSISEPTDIRLRKWKRLLARHANILSKYLVLKGIEIGPKYVLPQWEGMHNQFWSWENGDTGIHFLYDELKHFSDVVSLKALIHKKFVVSYRVESKRMCDSVVANISNLSQGNHQKKTNKQLIKLFDKFCNEYIRLGTTIVMTLEELQDELLNELSGADDLAVLATPPDLSIESEEELSRLEVIAYIEKNHKDLFISKTTKSIEKQLPQHPKLKKKIEDHVNNFCWLPLNFEKKIWDDEFFINLFKKYLSDHYDYQARIQELKQYPEKTKEHRNQLFKKLSAKGKVLADLLEATSYIRFYRATIFSLAYYRGYPILNEIATRLNCSLESIKFATPQEITEALAHNQKLNPKKLLQRREAFVMLVISDQYEQYEGKEALRVITKEFRQISSAETAEIKGMPAFKGIVRGTVKIIHDARDLGSLHKGDILVCEATNPDLVIAMSLAGAIVTNEGGVTSHAAIVARELRKPCIIGTKIATKVLKDGDVVEVDANQGVVKILK